MGSRLALRQMCNCKTWPQAALLELEARSEPNRVLATENDLPISICGELDSQFLKNRDISHLDQRPNFVTDFHFFPVISNYQLFTFR